MTNSVKQFAVAASEGEQPPLEFTHSFGLGGVDYEVRLPTKSEIALWMVATGNGTQAGYDETIRFVTNVLHDSEWDDDENQLREDAPDDFDPDAQMNSIYRRWRNPRDGLSVGDFVPVIRWLIEEAALFPTTSSSGSSSGQPASGRSSTRATPKKASTRARSTPAASAG